jgi:hypothetical protein
MIYSHANVAGINQANQRIAALVQVFAMVRNCLRTRSIRTRLEALVVGDSTARNVAGRHADASNGGDCQRASKRQNSSVAILRPSTRVELSGNESCPDRHMSGRYCDARALRRDMSRLMGGSKNPPTVICAHQDYEQRKRLPGSRSVQSLRQEASSSTSSARRLICGFLGIVRSSWMDQRNKINPC